MRIHGVRIPAYINNAGNLKTKTRYSVNNQNNNVVQDNRTEEQKILDNLKGLLEEPEEKENYIQDETQGTKEMKVTTQSGETVIVRE